MIYLRSKKAWASLIGLLLAIATGCLFYFLFLQPQKGGSTSLNNVDQETKEAAKEAQIDTSSQLSVYQSTRNKLDAINERNKKRSDELMGEIADMQKY